MSKQIFYVESCDIWKSRESGKVIWIGTSSQKLKMYVSKCIEDGRMIYSNDELSLKKQAELFRKDWENQPRIVINGRLNYGFINYCYNNEEV